MTAAYLLVFPSDDSFPLFSAHVAPTDRKASVSAHQVYRLREVHAIPLVPDLAKTVMSKLEKEAAKRAAGTRWRFSLSAIAPRGPGQVDTYDPEPESAVPEVVPEADDTPEPAPKRFSRGWRKAATSDYTLDPPQRRDLESKIIKQIIAEFTAGGFFYSHDFDLTHSLQYKRRIISARSASGAALADLLGKEPNTAPPSYMANDDFVEPDVHVPLWRRVDRRFFWNESLLQDFVDLGLHAYVIPIMQGWVQSSSFSIPIPPSPLSPEVSLGDVPVDLVVISRRSRDRAGLRYQRRGIDDQGHVANMVETEMIVRAKVGLATPRVTGPLISG